MSLMWVRIPHSSVVKPGRESAPRRLPGGHGVVHGLLYGSMEDSCSRDVDTGFRPAADVRPGPAGSRRAWMRTARVSGTRTGFRSPTQLRVRIVRGVSDP